MNEVSARLPRPSADAARLSTAGAEQRGAALRPVVVSTAALPPELPEPLPEPALPEPALPGLAEPSAALPVSSNARPVPLPESATRLAELLGAPERFGTGSLTDVLLKQVRDETSLDVKRADFKLDMLQPHLFMNFRVVDEHGRQLG